MPDPVSTVESLCPVFVENEDAFKEVLCESAVPKSGPGHRKCPGEDVS